MEIKNKAYWKFGLIIIAIIFAVSFINCKKETEQNTVKNNKPSLSGIVLFVVGDVHIGTKKLKTGDIISENELVQTGKKSVCDLQIKEMDAEIVMRMKADSEFQLKNITVKGKQVPSAIVSVGNSMVNVSKKMKNNENFNVVTPTMVAGVRGTKFEVSVSQDGVTGLVVSEGKVATRVRISEAEDLPEEIQEKSIMIRSVKESLESQEQIIEAGNKTVITKEQTNKILKETGIGESIKQIQFNSQERLSPEQIQTAANTVDKNLKPMEKESHEVTKSVQDHSSFKVEQVKEVDLQTKLKEYSELIAVEKQKLETVESTNVVLKDRTEKNKELLVKRIEKITGKSFETLILKSGKKVKGIIFLEGNQYFVITPEGQENYKEEEVEGMEL